jgi:hypothetical protein
MTGPEQPEIALGKRFESAQAQQGVKGIAGGLRGRSFARRRGAGCFFFRGW